MSTEKLDEAALLKTASEHNEFLNLHEVVAKARQNLDQNAWSYISVGAHCFRNGVRALKNAPHIADVVKQTSNDNVREIAGKGRS
jgi:hypothetical protein